MEDQIEFEEVTSEKKKSLLTHAGYYYCFHKASKNDDTKEFYRCVVKKPYCPGRIAVDATWIARGDGSQFKRGRITSDKPHHHPAKAYMKKVGKLPFCKRPFPTNFSDPRSQ
jgi:hypothetical protein